MSSSGPRRFWNPDSHQHYYYSARTWWDPDSKQYYYYDARFDSLIFQNGRRVQRPMNVPRDRFLPAQPAPNPHGEDAISDVAADIAAIGLQSNPQTQDKSNIVRFQDPSTMVRTSYSSGPAQQITDPYLYGKGVYASTLLLPTDNGSGPANEELFEGYRRRTQPRNFFKIGKVFLVLWAEPAGENATQYTTQEPGLTIGMHGQHVFSKVRRFVVIRESGFYCTCLPITSYNRQGVAKRGVKKSEHSIIFSGKFPPEPQPGELPSRGEEGMRPHAIRVDTDDVSYKLDNLSRLDYAAVHTIQHNIKVKSFGKVNPKSMNALLRQFDNVWSSGLSLGASLVAPSKAEAAASARPQGSASSQGPAAISSAGLRRGSQSIRFEGSESSRRGRSDTVTSTVERRPSGRELSEGENIRALLQAQYRKLVARGFSEAQARKIVNKRIQSSADDDDDDEDEDADEDDDDEEGDANADVRDVGDNQSDGHSEADAGNSDIDDENSDDDDENGDDGDEGDEKEDEIDGEGDGGGQNDDDGSDEDEPEDGPSNRAKPTARGRSQLQIQEAYIRQYVKEGFTREQAVARLKRARAQPNSLR